MRRQSALLWGIAIAVAVELGTPTTFADGHFNSDNQLDSHLPKFVLWNVSASVPRGLYWLRPAGSLQIGELVADEPPRAVASYAATRGYLSSGVPLLKHVAALPGQTVCRFGPSVTVDGQVVAQARDRDSHGRSLPIWHGCRQLRAGQVFLLNTSVPDSFDGRYFGVVPATTITAKAEPLWTEP